MHAPPPHAAASVPAREPCAPRHAGPQLDLPQSVTVAQLETLLNGLLSNEEKLPYSFFVDDVELSDELGQHLLKHKVWCLTDCQ